MRKVEFEYEHTIKTITKPSWQICSDSCSAYLGCSFWQYDTQSKTCKLIDDYFDITTTSTNTLLGQSKY